MQTFKNYLESRFNSPKIKDLGEENINSLTSALGSDNPELIVRIQKELLQGKPVAKEKYYDLTGFPKEKADGVLEIFGETDEQGNILAFAGLSIIPTRHKLMVNGKELYTWCALDAIVFTDWLDITSHVFSQDPIDNTSIQLKMEADHLNWAKPFPLYISWVKNIDTCDIRGSVCNHVHFFASEATANQWLKDNPEGKIFSIDDFFERIDT